MFSKPRSLRVSRPLLRRFARLEMLEQRQLLSVAPQGSEQLVNTLVHGAQVTDAESVAVAVTSAGDGVIVFGGNGTDDPQGVFARRITAAGALTGSDFRVNTTTAGIQQTPAVAIRDNGEFVIAWAGRGAGDHDGIFVRRFDANGNALGNEILVNTTTGGVQEQPAIAMATDGQFTVTWSGVGSGDVNGVFLRRFAANGTPSGAEVRVNSTVASQQAYASIGIANDGTALVAWSSRDQDGDDWGVFGQRYTSTGAVSGAEFQINTTTTDSQFRPSVGFDSTGNTVVVWTTHTAAGGWDVVGRRFGPTGTALAGEFAVNSQTGGNQQFAKVAVAADGRFVVAYQSGIENGTGWEVFVREFNIQGVASGPETLVNGTQGFASGHQEQPSIATSDAQRAVVVWSGRGAVDRHGVYVRGATEGEAPNGAPVLAAIGNTTIDEGTLLTFTATATDPNPADTRTFSLEGAPAGATINPTTGVFTWTPTEAQGPGTYTVTIRVTDNGTPVLSDSEQITITVNEVNLAPVLAPIGNKTVAQGQPLTFTATATDPDLPANTLTFSLDPADTPAGATINPTTGVFTWTPTQAGTFTATIRVTDNGTPPLNDFEQITFTVTAVNQAPTLAPITPITIDELTQATFTAVGTDPDAGSVLTYSLEGAPAGATINPTTGVFTWTPTEAQGPGAFNFTVRVTDNGTPAQSATRPVTITVNEVNLPPNLAPPGAKTVPQGGTLTFTATATDPDLPANTLTFQLDPNNTPSGATIDSTTGVFSWTPGAAQAPGDYVVTILVIDNGVPALSDSETFTITVTQPNQAPVLAAIGNQMVDEGTLLTFTATATDPDAGSALVFSLENAPAGATIDPATGVFSFTPTEAQGPGTFDVTVRVTDNGNPALSDFEVVTITVNEVNLPPNLAPPGDKTVAQGATLTFTATATDPDLPANTLTFLLDPSNTPPGATIDSTTGLFTCMVSPALAPGDYSVTILVVDSGVPALADSETFTITVTSTNQAPVLAAIGGKTVDEGSLLSFTATATDPNAGSALTFSLEDAPAGATIDPLTGVFAFTPTEAQGPGTFNVTVRVTDDGNPALDDFEVVAITVNEINLPPNLAPPGNMTVVQGDTLTFTAMATDPDLPANTLTFILDPNNTPPGATIDSTTGLFTWAVGAGQAPGNYLVTILVIDNGVPAFADSETFTIEVTESTALAASGDPVQQQVVGDALLSLLDEPLP